MNSNIVFCHASVIYEYTRNGKSEATEAHASRVTFAAHYVDGGETTYAAAWCAHVDNFCKATGRRIAESRLNHLSPTHVETVDALSGAYIDFWESVFANAMSSSPSRWNILSINFTGRSAGLVTL